MNVELADDVWDQATLPVANGGLGIRRASDIALSAFLSSVTGSHLLITDLLPQHLHATSGTNDSPFKAEVDEWQTHSCSTSVQSPLLQERKVWDISGGEGVINCT